METIILTKENQADVMSKLNELSKDRKYWIGIASSRIESVEDESHDWFRGVGTFERIVRLRIYENHNGRGLQINHVNTIDNTSVIPEDDTIQYGSELMIDGGDILYYEHSRPCSPRGVTNLYMEWTKERSNKYNPQKMS